VSLVSALAAAGAPFVGEASALELARNLAWELELSENKLETVVERAIETRRRPRHGAWLLTDEVQVDALIDALIATAKEHRRVCTDCGGFGAPCSFCSNEAA
jgi:hypothetical protein